MGETTDQIERHIEDQREDLRSNLRELEDRMKSVMDWRRQFRRNPAVGLGLAVGGGLLLAGLFGGAGPRRESGQRRARVYSPAHAAHQAARSDGGRGRGQILHAWDNLTSALIGIVAAKITDSLGQAVVGLVDNLAGSAGAGSTEPRASGNGVQGEGDYRAARRYRAAAERYAHTADVRRAARNAAPRNEAEAEDMAEAEAEGRARAKPS